MLKKTIKKEPIKIECIAIQWEILNPLHPSFRLNGCIDKTPLADIIGINQTVFKQDVSNFFSNKFIQMMQF